MKASELAQMLKQIAWQLQSNDPNFDRVLAVEVLNVSAERLDDASKVTLLGAHPGALKHAQSLGNQHALDFALGAGWHAERVEKGLL